MKAKSFYKNNKHNNMNPKEKENNQEEELKTQATPNECDEETVGQETSQENEAPLTEEEKLAQELEKANEQIEEQKDKYLRLSAEFDNYRKRTMKEKAELILNGGEKSISSILPIVDDFERALKNMDRGYSPDELVSSAFNERQLATARYWCAGYRHCLDIPWCYADGVGNAGFHTGGN